MQELFEGHSRCFQRDYQVLGRGDWEEILERCNDCVSVSKFIRDAIEERLNHLYHP